jgi:bifunctional non-homologous end joining protein LigD
LPLVDQPPDGDEWIHEIKHDSYRTLLAPEDGKIQGFTRRGADWMTKYGAVVRQVAELPARSAILYGEFRPARLHRV